MAYKCKIKIKNKDNAPPCLIIYLTENLLCTSPKSLENFNQQISKLFIILGFEMHTVHNKYGKIEQFKKYACVERFQSSFTMAVDGKGSESDFPISTTPWVWFLWFHREEARVNILMMICAWRVRTVGLRAISNVFLVFKKTQLCPHIVDYIIHWSRLQTQPIWSLKTSIIYP